MERTPQFPLTGVDGPTEAPDTGNLTGGNPSLESIAGWIISLEVILASALLPFLYWRVGFYTPVPPRLPVFPHPLHRFSGRNVLDAPRRCGGALLYLAR
jgi:hypothetical protein